MGQFDETLKSANSQQRLALNMDKMRSALSDDEREDAQVHLVYRREIGGKTEALVITDLGVRILELKAIRSYKRRLSLEHEEVRQFRTEAAQVRQNMFGHRIVFDLVKGGNSYFTTSYSTLGSYMDPSDDTAVRKGIDRNNRIFDDVAHAVHLAKANRGLA